MIEIIIAIWTLLNTLLLLFVSHEFSLLLYALFKRKKKKNPSSNFIAKEKVIIQLPVYNEKFVIERLLSAVVRLNYPNELLEIQVLDDSKKSHP